MHKLFLLWGCSWCLKLEKPKGYQIHRGKDFPRSSVGNESACNAGDLASVPKSRRSPREGNGNPLQYSCLENPMDGGAWWATVHGLQRVGHDWATSLSLSLSYEEQHLVLCFLEHILKVPRTGELQRSWPSLASFYTFIEVTVSVYTRVLPKRLAPVHFCSPRCISIKSSMY